MIASCTFGSRNNCVVEYDGLKDVLKVDIQNCPPLDGDIRIKFHSTSVSCDFYFVV